MFFCLSHKFVLNKYVCLFVEEKCVSIADYLEMRSLPKLPPEDNFCRTKPTDHHHHHCTDQPKFFFKKSKNKMKMIHALLRGGLRTGHFG